ncbi:MAG: hypothetical protein GTO41_04515, partial [Burkholderiales bacterium]|nr:hypothetical protein [Burkholderiales bacterium]
NHGCDNTAKWSPFLICRDADGNILLEGDTHLAICDDCKDVATVDVLMSDIQFAAMCEAFAAQDKTPPRRSDIEIELRLL